MSRNQRLALVAGAIIVAVAAFVIVQSGGNDSSGSSGGTTTARIAIAGNKVTSGPSTITVKKGATVHIVVTADKPNTIHLHGYDIEKQAAPGKPAHFDFKADAEGVFEIESHTFEHAGLEPRVSRLVVRPS